MQQNNSRLFQIGEVARMYHVSVGTLRHYEKAGLLTPEYIDEHTGYRYYGIRQFECLNTIRYLRVLDMPLEDIRDFVQNRNIDKIREMLVHQKEEVVNKQQELRMIERKIEHRLQQIDDALASELEMVHVIQVPPRRLAWIGQHLKPKSYLDLEYAIRELEQSAAETVIFLGKAGVGISAEQLEAGQYLQYDRVFIILDDEDQFNGEVLQLPEETCVTIRFCGNHSVAGGYYKRLMRYIVDNHWSVTGFSREITMIDDGMTEDVSRFVTEIQIPVKNEK